MSSRSEPHALSSTGALNPIQSLLQCPVLMGHSSAPTFFVVSANAIDVWDVSGALRMGVLFTRGRAAIYMFPLLFPLLLCLSVSLQYIKSTLGYKGQTPEKDRFCFPHRGPSTSRSG